MLKQMVEENVWCSYDSGATAASQVEAELEQQSGGIMMKMTSVKLKLIY